MDLSRRFAAGELAELFGAIALEEDRRMRIHRFRRVAQQVVARTNPEERALLDAYVAGVNAGIESLAGRPCEYWLLRTKPQAWRAEDSILVVLSMYEQLNYSAFAAESSRGLVHDEVPAVLYRFLYQRGTEWDAPLGGVPMPPEPIPSPDEVNLRGQALAQTQPLVSSDEEGLRPGSNNWAVAGALTASGHALLANDMHLGLGIPNTWYRARWQVMPPAGGTAAIDMAGVTLPGVPVIVAGSNGHVAWGFTNSYGDWTDLIVLREDAAHPDQYATPGGYRAFEHHRETIKVKGRGDEALDVLDTIWGPVFDRDHAGRRRAAAWIAQAPEATNVTLAQLESVQDVASALDVANRVGAPPQNFVAADERGNIGWTIMGRIPVRGSGDSSIPSDWSQPGGGWSGWLEPDRYPRILNPAGGRIWTANARVVDGAALHVIGDGDFELGARARQIRDDLLQLKSATEADMLAIQLDDRAVFLQRWRSKLLTLLDGPALAGHPARGQFRSLVEKSADAADVGSVGYRLLRAWRNSVQGSGLRNADRERASTRCGSRRDSDRTSIRGTAVATALGGACTPAEPGVCELARPRAAQPRCRDRGATAGLRHAREVLVGEAQSGDREPPARAGNPSPRMASEHADTRVARRCQHATRAGAAFRSFRALRPLTGARSAGRTSICPAVRADIPLSPYYRAGHDAWAEGRPLAFLPGPAEHHLHIHPDVSRAPAAVPAGP